MLLLAACNPAQQMTSASNPLLQEWDTPHQLPPFEEIHDAHFLPALKQSIAAAQDDVQSIIDNPAPPTFQNTIVAMELAGAQYARVAGVFYNLIGSDSNDELKETAKQFQPVSEDFLTFIYSHPALYKRVKAIQNERESLQTDEQRQLLKYHYRNFQIRGIGLSADKQKRLADINRELGQLSREYSERVLEDTNQFEMLLMTPAELAGLPEAILVASQQLAESRIEEGDAQSFDKYNGKHLFIPERASMYPFLTYSTRRDLRKKLYSGYTERGMQGDDEDVTDIIRTMLQLRKERAQMLGFEDHIALQLDDRVAPDRATIEAFLKDVWWASLKQFQSERERLRKVAQSYGQNEAIQGYDWWFYAEKVRQQDYRLSEEEVRQYLPVASVVEGAFDLAKRLYGVRMVERKDLPKYIDTVQTFEVHDEDDQLIGIYYADYYVRPGKRAGAWMNTFRDQSNIQGNAVVPIVVNVCNFPNAQGDTPSLLTLEQAETFFHEFGHAIHGLLSNVTYPSISGTSVPRDFVEFPSQVLEPWMVDPEFMPTFARHYKSGAPIPSSLIKRINDSGNFNQGFATVEYLSAALLDLAFHDGDNANIKDVVEFEDDFLKSIKMPPGIEPRYRSGYFSHIFAGGYSAGYYSYLWSEIFAADTFEYFKKEGLFNKRVATAFKDEILSRGGSIEPLEAYRKFRGKDANAAALLRSRGFSDE